MACILAVLSGCHDDHDDHDDSPVAIDSLEFAAPRAYGGTRHPVRPTAGDFNGDGFMDIAVLDHSQAAVCIYHGNAAARFSAPTYLVLPSLLPYRVPPVGPQVPLIAEDFDRDGRTDLFAQTLAGASIVSMGSNGEYRVIDAVGIPPLYFAAVADWNVDGLPDVVGLRVGASTSDRVQSFVGIAPGEFQFLGSLAEPGGLPLDAVLTADLDSDGLPDLAFWGSSGGACPAKRTWFLRGDGAFGFDLRSSLGSIVPTVALVDVDGDARDDAFLAGSCFIPHMERRSKYVCLNRDNAATWDVFDHSDQSTIGGYGFGDMDGDGHLDVIESFSQTFLLRGDGAGDLTRDATPILSAISLEISTPDVDADSRLDIVFTTDDLLVVIDTAATGFSERTLRDVGPLPYAVAGGDWVGSTEADLAVSAPGSVLVFQGAGDGGFLAGGEVALGATPRHFADGDFDVDGRVDLATAVEGNGASGLVILRREPSGLTSTTNLATEDAASDLMVDDVNQDGLPDLVVASESASVIRTYTGNGAFDFAPGQVLPTEGLAHSLALADFDEDGRSDLAVAGYDGISVHFGSRSGLGPAIRVAALRNIGQLSVVDLELDRHIDVVATTTNEIGRACVAILKGDGLGAFSESSVCFDFIGSPVSSRVKDLNGDQFPDLAVTLVGRQPILCIAAGDGAGSFFPAQALMPSLSVFAMEALDIDGDGLDDLVTSCIRPPEIAILHNESKREPVK